jgi:hypothetical protein
MSVVEQESGPFPLMTVPCPRYPWRKAAALTIVAPCVLAGMLAAAVHAADDAGVYDFLHSQARQGGSEAAPRWPSPRARAPAPRAAARVAPIAGRQHRHTASRPMKDPALRGPRALARTVPQEPVARFTSLPRVEEPVRARKLKAPPVIAATSRKPKPLAVPIAAGADPVAALLRDPTLRPGDIVMFPDGPRVFKGARALPHRADKFERVEHSRLVSKASRKAVLAFTKSVTDPGNEPGRYLPSALSSPAPTAPQLEARSEAVRVVYPTATP